MGIQFHEFRKKNRGSLPGATRGPAKNTARALMTPPQKNGQIEQYNRTVRYS